MRVSGENADYGGDVVIAAGVLEVYKTANNALGSLAPNRPVTIQNGATVSLLSVGAYNALGYGGNYPSLITVEAGGTLVASSAAFNAHNVGSLALSGGTVSALNANHDTYGNFVINGQISHTGNTASLISAPAISFRAPGGSVNVADGTAANDLTISSALLDHDGISTLTKTGNGKLLLTGASSYTGATLISGGTLQVGNGGTTGALGSGAVTNDTLLVFNRSDTLTVLNAIGGTGTVNNDGGVNNILNLNGAQTYSTLNANFGTTNVNGAFTAGTATVNANATVNFYASQTLAALNIADGVEVTFGDGMSFAPPPAKAAFGSGSVVLVPEPGSLALLLGGLGLLVSRRRRA